MPTSKEAARQEKLRSYGQAEQLSFWRGYLDGAPTVLNVPADHRRPEQPGRRDGVQPFALGAGLTAGLQELSRSEQAMLGTTLTAAFAALLSRYTGQEDLLIAVGQFPRTVVHRADLAGEPTTLELLRRTRASTQETLPHRDVPFDAVVRELRPERIPGCPPLVQVALAIGPAATSAPDPAPAPSPGPTFDLSVEVEERTDGLSGRFVYDRGLFEPATIRQLAGHWQLLLEGMVAQPERPVSQLELLAEPERRQLLEQWSAGGAVPDGPAVEELIEAQARTRPDAVAMVCEGVLLTYRELLGQASQLAQYLRGRGVGPGVAVGVCLDRSAEQVVALLAILRAGGVYVPLDPATPAERIRYVVQDTGMPLLLTQAWHLERVGGNGTQVVCLDADEAAMVQAGEQQQPEQVSRDGQAAYIIYTSGSTGQPKGVVVERAALSAHCRAMIEVYGLGWPDRVLQFSQYSFDASLEQILPTLAAGARLVMRGDELWSPRQLLREIQRQQLTVLNLPSAYWQQAVREWGQAPGALTGTRLRLVIAGGERLGRPGLEQWPRLGLPQARLLNAYGPTETTITATMAEIRPDDEWITIGRPLPGRTTYILDGHGQPVPAGVVGELYVGGELLARGYLNRAELTAQRFEPDPFAGHPDARRYRTGDRARYLADGRIEYLGREDQQVKIRGYRIELGEVEAALAQHPDIAEAVVVARPGSRGAELAAFVVARTGTYLDSAGLAQVRGFLRDRLPAYMVPPVIEPLADLPRLATGKPDRRRLQETPRGAGRPAEGYVAPRLPIHEQLVRVWQELLDVRPIGITDNFFDLGGHSLLAAQLVDWIDQEYGQKLGLSTLFGRPTIEQLAEELKDLGGPEPERAAQVKLRAVQENGTRPPLFFLHGDWTGGAFYCFALARGCGADQPFYVLEPYVFSDAEPVPTMEAVAAAHLQAIQAVQPKGPYRLGGFCNGGLLAYEMARQLERQGERVEFLGLVNPSAPFQAGPVTALADKLYGALHVPTGAQVTSYLRLRQALRHVYRRLKPAGDRVLDFGKLLVIEPRLAAMFPPREALYRDYVGVFDWLAAHYRTGRYRGDVSYYWAREDPAIARSWRSLIRRNAPAGHREHTIEGALMSSVTDHVEGLARKLSADLGQAGPSGTRAEAAH
ncbi:MAG TPA: amino acid adenylation domain-containing protein [Streptosporangiaceae bacterium]|jgi:amino acid adenylation domain-containing protein